MPTIAILMGGRASAMPPDSPCLRSRRFVWLWDGAFDLLVCNSVLEHVPPSERAALAREMHRVARRVFCQTPAFGFPVEPHFIMPFVHWLPRRLGYWLAHVSPWRILSRPDPETIRSYWWDTCLLTRKELRALFPRGELLSERFLGLTKSHCVIVDPSRPVDL